MPNLPSNFDWRRSPEHIRCLSCFRNPNTGKYAFWYTIKESPEAALERWVRDGAIAACDLPTKVAHKLTIAQLKEVLKSHEKRISGGKAQLVEAAVITARDEMEAATRDLTLYECTPLALQLLEEFDQAKCEAEILAQTQSHEQLLAENAKAAFATFVAFQRGFVAANYPGGSEEVETLMVILGSGPKTVGHLDVDDLRTLRAAAAMKTLWRLAADAAWLPENFVTPKCDNARAVRLLLCHANSRETIARYSTWCKSVKLAFDKNDVDVCEHCAALDGTVHNIDEVPEIPTEYCTSRNGCICELDNADEHQDFDYLSLGVAASQEAQEGPDADENDPVQRLRQLKQMLDEQLIEPAEYDEKKREILGRM
jgi:hypothetical protein